MKYDVLLVDYDPATISILMERIADAGLSSHHVKSGPQAVKAIEDHVFRLVMTEPGMLTAQGENLIKFCRSKKLACLVMSDLPAAELLKELPPDIAIVSKQQMLTSLAAGQFIASHIPRRFEP